MLTAGFSAESPSSGAAAKTGGGSTVDVGTLSFGLACAPSRGAAVVEALLSAWGVVSITGTVEGAASTVGDE